jgi:hypothetical protein
VSSPFENQPNPYSAPNVDFRESAKPHFSGDVTPRTIELLRQTRPWVWFLGVLGILGSVLMFCGSGFMFFGAGGVGGGPGNPLAFIAVIYVIMALFYIVPSLMLIRYGQRISNLMAERSTYRLEMAIEAQRSFWRFLGIVIAVMIAIYLVIIVGSIVMRVQ